MQIPRTESEGFNTTIIIRDDLERDEDFEAMLIADEQDTLLYKTILFSLLILLFNLFGW